MQDNDAFSRNMQNYRKLLFDRYEIDIKIYEDGVVVKLLVVDDEKTVRALISSMVEDRDYEVMFAASGEEAWELLQNITEPVIALVDWIMPGIDGIELCRRIKRQGIKATHIHVIILTVKSDIEDVVIGFDAGADDFLSKPVDSRELSCRLSVGKRILRYQYELEQRNAALQSTTQVLENIMKELAGANERLTALSMLDGLTGIANRRKLDEYMTREWRNARRERSPITFLMIDIDFFKSFNDIYGHLRGDECLKIISSILVDNVKRGGDLVARYGGEEFAMVLPNTDSAGGQAVADNIFAKLEAVKIPHAASAIGPYVTVSMGVATMIPEANSNYTSLIDKADEALYEAKRCGRCRRVVYKM